jgi:hypothetical protein
MRAGFPRAMQALLAGHPLSWCMLPSGCNSGFTRTVLLQIEQYERELEAQALSMETMASEREAARSAMAEAVSRATALAGERCMHRLAAWQGIAWPHGARPEQAEE